MTESVSEGTVSADVFAELHQLGWVWDENGGTQPDLRRDLERSERIKGLVKDRGFAFQLYRALCDAVWICNFRRWQVGMETAAELVAALRPGDSLADFWNSGGEGTVAPDVAAELVALGWTRRRARP